MHDLPAVLMIDDDPSHLQVYGWILGRGGFRPVPVLVKYSGLDLPESHVDIRVVVLDYRLGTGISAVDVAQKVKRAYPNVPILVLSDLYGMPDDIAPYTQTFVRKGDPEHLLSELRKVLSQ